MVHDRHVVISVLFAAASLSFALPSAAFACDLPPGQKGTVAEVRDGETLALTDGTLVRLINAKAPAAPLAARSDRPWPLRRRACLGRRDRVATAAPRLIVMAARWPRSMWSRAASACGCKASWSARVSPASIPSPTITLASTISSPARPRRGQRARACGATWAYRVLDAGNVERLGRLTRSYQLVEGVVAEVGESGGRLYLNFDKDWRKDFTILMERKDGEAFKAAGIDPKALAGKKLWVRGWV